MNQLQIFHHPLFQQVRFMELDGKPFAVGVDIARALDYSNPSKAVIDHCKGITKLGMPSQGGIQETNLIPEGDIYRLIVKAADQSRNTSIKAKAEQFESWVFEDVLPTIRKTGAYMTPDTLVEALGSIDGMIQVLTRLKDEQTARAIAEAKIVTDAPKVALYDTVMNAHNNKAVGTVAKMIGYGRNKLFEFLREQKILRFNNEPYQAYIDRGYFEVRLYPVPHTNGEIENKTQTVVTPKGIDYIHKQLVLHGKVTNKEATA